MNAYILYNVRIVLMYVCVYPKSVFRGMGIIIWREISYITLSIYSFLIGFYVRATLMMCLFMCISKEIIYIVLLKSDLLFLWVLY